MSEAEVRCMNCPCAYPFQFMEDWEQGLRLSLQTTAGILIMHKAKVVSVYAQEGYCTIGFEDVFVADWLLGYKPTPTHTFSVRCRKRYFPKQVMPAAEVNQPVQVQAG